MRQRCPANAITTSTAAGFEIGMAPGVRPPQTIRHSSSVENTA